MNAENPPFKWVTYLEYNDDSKNIDSKDNKIEKEQSNIEKISARDSCVQGQWAIQCVQKNTKTLRKKNQLFNCKLFFKAKFT